MLDPCLINNPDGLPLVGAAQACSSVNLIGRPSYGILEQVYRDNGLNPIHEGTHGIQAIDLVGRKILRDSGAALALLGERITGADCPTPRTATI